MLTAFGAFHVPPTILVGGGVRREVVAQLQKYLIQRVLLVTDVGMMQLGPAREIAALLDDAGVSVTIYDGVQPDPTDQNVAHGLDLFRSNDCQAIVAVGGGSPIDAAKAISVLTTNSSPLSQYAGYHKIPRAGAPLIAIPTTAGTGSEATKVAVITDTTQDVKSMILSVHLVPTAALVDYELTLSMPPDLTAAVGVDTLTHGIEAYVSRKANGMTDPLALSCIELVAKHLRKAYREPNNHDARAGDDAGGVSGRDGVRQQQRLFGPRHEPSDRGDLSCAARFVECGLVADGHAVLVAGQHHTVRDRGKAAELLSISYAGRASS